MQKITPFLWFDGQAEAAAKSYASIFKNSKILSVSPMSATFELAGQKFIALNGGPQFKFTPAISFFVECKTQPEINKLWQKLSVGGIVLMALDKYPFSKKFGWLQDKFGVSWQLTLAGRAQKISPFLMFVGRQHGRAREAINFYVSLFKNSKVSKLDRYGSGEDERAGTVKHAVFSLNGQKFMAIDSGREHPFTFTEAVSFFVSCKTQKEIDCFWKKLSAGGRQSRCGWLKDKFGVSWQVVPPILGEMLSDEDSVKSNRVMEAMLKMGKLDIKKLKHAYEQR
ncbi:MAG: VOC family protein [Verrucomicrobia bacterium]|nr:VOC family protein [Verrucomicrobiota bacterium]